MISATPMVSWYVLAMATIVQSVGSSRTGGVDWSNSMSFT